MLNQTFLPRAASALWGARTWDAAGKLQLKVPLRIIRWSIQIPYFLHAPT